jgi:hypothetical protein
MKNDKQIIKTMTSNLPFIHEFADRCFEAQPAEIDEDGRVVWKAVEAAWDCDDIEAYDYFMELNGIKHFSSDWLFDNEKDRERAYYLLVEDEQEALHEIMTIINAYKETRR